MAHTRIVIEGVGSNWSVEIDGPGGPRGLTRIHSDTKMVDFLEEYLERRRQAGSAPRAPGEQIAPIPPNYCPPITRRSRRWAELKEQEKTNVDPTA